MRLNPKSRPCDLTAPELDGIRQRVHAGIEAIESGDYTDYEGREGLKQLAEEVKARGRKLLDNIR